MVAHLWIRHCVDGVPAEYGLQPHLQQVSVEQVRLGGEGLQGPRT